MSTNEEPAHGWNREAGLAHRSSERNHSTGNAAADQRQRLLQRLADGSVSTIETRRDLDILAPAARVFELRHHYGYDIQTVWVRQATDCGRVHRVALYQLFPHDPNADADSLSVPQKEAE